MTTHLARIARVQAGLNTGRLLPSRIVLSPDVMFDIQSEVAQVGGAFFYEGGLNMRESILGIPVTIDPRLGPGHLAVEVDA